MPKGNHRRPLTKVLENVYGFRTPTSSENIFYRHDHKRILGVYKRVYEIQ